MIAVLVRKTCRSFYFFGLGRGEVHKDIIFLLAFNDKYCPCVYGILASFFPNFVYLFYFF